MEDSRCYQAHDLVVSQTPERAKQALRQPGQKYRERLHTFLHPMFTILNARRSLGVGRIFSATKDSEATECIWDCKRLLSAQDQSMCVHIRWLEPDVSGYFYVEESHPNSS